MGGQETAALRKWRWIGASHDRRGHGTPSHLHLLHLGESRVAISKQQRRRRHRLTHTRLCALAYDSVLRIRPPWRFPLPAAAVVPLTATDATDATAATAARCSFCFGLCCFITLLLSYYYYYYYTDRRRFGCPSETMGKPGTRLF